MKILLLSDERIRLEGAAGPLTIEADRPRRTSPPSTCWRAAWPPASTPSCTPGRARRASPWTTWPSRSAGSSWRTPTGWAATTWRLVWPSLPEARRAAAERAAHLCTVHKTFEHPPEIETRVARGMSFPVVRFVFGGREAPRAGRGPALHPRLGRHVPDLPPPRPPPGALGHRAASWRRVPSQNTSVLARFPWIPPEAYAEAVQLVGPGGRTWQGAAAIEQLLRVLPHGGLLGWVFGVPLVGPLLDRFYRWFARNRYRFGCGEHCQSRPLDVRYSDE